jgi:hypothetical protein
MRGIFTFVFAATVATLAAGGCSSDSPAGTGATQCTGDYAALTPAQFESQLSSSGKCAGASDSAVVCGNDVTTIAEQCGDDCFNTKALDDATQDACTKSCIEAGTTPTLSSACIGCYVTDVGCARDHCLLICGTDPTGSACLSCRISNGCAQAFFACSGLPSGGIGSGEAGAGGASGEVPAAGAGGA